MNIIKQHLPGYCYSKYDIKSVEGAVIHFVSAKNILPDDPFNLDAIIGIFKEYGVSAKYLIRRDGTVIELVPDMRRSHHAGKSRMNGRDGCNKFTIGIELEGGSDWPYTDEQMLILGELLAQLMTEHKFTLDWIQGHDKIRADWNKQYPSKKASKKVDPGEHFNWEILEDMLASVSVQIKHEQNIG